MTHKTDQIESAETELNVGLSNDSNERMGVLIVELVQANQELRFNIANLKDKIERLEKGQPNEVPWVGMLI